MKKWFILLYSILVLLLSGCSSQPGEVIAAVKEEYPSSKISSTDCYLCGPDRPFDFIERPHDTIMILCLNTWDLGDTKMYEYDEQGNDSNYSGASILRYSDHEADECKWAFSSNTGYHTCELRIQYGETSYLDPETLATQLCHDCLEEVYDQAMDIYDPDSIAYCDVLYDTATGNIYPISQVTSPYHIGNYWIHVEHDTEHVTDNVYIVHNPDSTK